MSNFDLLADIALLENETSLVATPYLPGKMCWLGYVVEIGEVDHRASFGTGQWWYTMKISQEDNPRRNLRDLPIIAAHEDLTPS